ncbi:hypothetical protein BKA93DRAFT_572281 [Sparassis latifolia]
MEHRMVVGVMVTSAGLPQLCDALAQLVVDNVQNSFSLPFNRRASDSVYFHGKLSPVVDTWSGARAQLMPYLSRSREGQLQMSAVSYRWDLMLDFLVR